MLKGGPQDTQEKRLKQMLSSSIDPLAQEIAGLRADVCALQDALNELPLQEKVDQPSLLARVKSFGADSYEKPKEQFTLN